MYEDFGLGVVLTPFPFPCSHAIENLVFEQDMDFQPITRIPLHNLSRRLEESKNLLKIL